MFAGHIGAGLAIGRAAPQVNVGVFIGAAMLLDLLLWPFVLAGWESVTIPADFAATHQPEFDFPYSHGLISSVAWSVLAGALAFSGHAGPRDARVRVAGLVAAAVFSHWVLDAVVHRPELPIAGAGYGVGLGLWQSMPLALALEVTIVLVGLSLFLQGSRLSRGKSLGLASLALLATLFTVAGMTIAPPPPSPLAMAGGSLATLIAVCALAWWLGRLPRETHSRADSAVC